MTFKIGLTDVSVYSKSKYVNLNDIQNPISPYSEYLGHFNLQPSLQLKAEAFIEPQEVTLEDNFFIPESIQKHTFNKVCDRKKIIVTSKNYQGLNVVNPYPFSLEIGISPHKYQYRRKVLGFLEVTGILGGLFELFEVTIGILIGSISSFTFRDQLIKEILNSKKNNNNLLRELK